MGGVFFSVFILNYGFEGRKFFFFYFEILVRRSEYWVGVLDIRRFIFFFWGLDFGSFLFSWELSRLFFGVIVCVGGGLGVL